MKMGKKHERHGGNKGSRKEAARPTYDLVKEADPAARGNALAIGLLAVAIIAVVIWVVLAKRGNEGATFTAATPAPPIGDAGSGLRQTVLFGVAHRCVCTD